MTLTDAAERKSKRIVSAQQLQDEKRNETGADQDHPYHCLGVFQRGHFLHALCGADQST